jgi:hypothetical protein
MSRRYFGISNLKPSGARLRHLKVTTIITETMGGFGYLLIFFLLYLS